MGRVYERAIKHRFPTHPNKIGVNHSLSCLQDANGTECLNSTRMKWRSPEDSFQVWRFHLFSFESWTEVFAFGPVLYIACKLR